MKTTKRQIGSVGVDSGQLLLCDPCYIENEWVSDSKNVQITYYLDTRTNEKWTFELWVADHLDLVAEHGIKIMSGRFDTPLESGEIPNELIAQGIWKKMQTDPINEFSYEGCMSQTGSENKAGQLVFKMGHAGAGVAFSSGYGDGLYPVFAEYNEDGRIIRVTVEMQ